VDIYAQRLGAGDEAARQRAVARLHRAAGVGRASRWAQYLDDPHVTLLVKTLDLAALADRMEGPGASALACLLAL
jgi:hypothetical protein